MESKSDGKPDARAAVRGAATSPPQSGHIDQHHGAASLAVVRATVALAVDAAKVIFGAGIGACAIFHCVRIARMPALLGAAHRLMFGHAVRSMLFAAVFSAVTAGGGSLYYRQNVLPRRYCSRAGAFIRERDYGSAAALYQRTLALRPDRSDLLYEIARTKEASGDTDSAMIYYEAYLKAVPTDARAMTRLGWLFMKAGRYEEALRLLMDAAQHCEDEDAHWRS